MIPVKGPGASLKQQQPGMLRSGIKHLNEYHMFLVSYLLTVVTFE